MFDRAKHFYQYFIVITNKTKKNVISKRIYKGTYSTYPPNSKIVIVIFHQLDIVTRNHIQC